jgi:hypothetical protein
MPEWAPAEVIAQGRSGLRYGEARQDFSGRYGR